MSTQRRLALKRGDHVRLRCEKCGTPVVTRSGRGLLLHGSGVALAVSTEGNRLDAKGTCPRCQTTYRLAEVDHKARTVAQKEADDAASS